MNIEQAHRWLDKVKEGHRLPQPMIDQALSLTGDLDDIHGELCGGWSACWQGQAKIHQQGAICADVHPQENDGLRGCST